MFLYAVPLMVLAFALTWALWEVPLRSAVHAVDHARAMAAGAAPGTAEPGVAGSLPHECPDPAPRGAGDPVGAAPPARRVSRGR
ncbi:MAG TPA: hypothetical protein VHM89_09975 [Acidimicrobiales bacterium]|nr:hypothetical protein [Acidimicrobiales bacterium]